MIQEGDKWYAFDDYTDEHLNARIAYWELEKVRRSADPLFVLDCMYAERDRRVDHKLLAWVEGK